MNEEKDIVYYDDSCYICSIEIGAIKKKGESCNIEFVDISDKNFNSNGKDYDTEMIGNFGGEETIGIETFRRLYEKMGYKNSVKFSRLPVISSLFDCGYYIFSHWVRPYLPKKSKK